MLESDVVRYGLDSEKVGAHANFLKRPSKEEYYLNIALAVAQRSTCLRSAYGAVATLHDRIVSTGFNGAARGLPNCTDTNDCQRQNVGTRSRYDLCRAVHAENNMISSCCTDIRGAVVYIAGFSRITGEEKLGKSCYPCVNCFRQMLNAGITNIWIRNEDRNPCCHFIEHFSFLEK